MSDETSSPDGGPFQCIPNADALAPFLMNIVSNIANCDPRVVRKIELACAGTGVVISNSLEQVMPPAHELPVAIWTVTQLPAAAKIIARLTPDAVAPGYADFPGGAWQSIEPRGQEIILHRPASSWQKIGLDADQLRAHIGDRVFTIEAPGAASGHAPHRRAQVFSDPDDSAFRLPGTTPYIELEFISSPQLLARDETTSMTTLWSLSATGADAF